MQLVSYLFFKNQAAEAFEFYRQCLGGEIAMKVTIGDMPDGDKAAPETRDLIAHVRLAVGDAELMGSDWCTPTGEPYPGMHGHAVSIRSAQPADAERIFGLLGEGGKVTMPMGETSWARRFGMLVETQPLPFVSSYSAGTCVPFRVQFRSTGAARTLSIDPWTCAEVLPPPDPNAP